MDIHEPKILTDGGPWAMHDYACPILRDRHAVLRMNDGIFTPSWDAQKLGWRTVRAQTPLQRWILRTFFKEWE